jgi:hypothetical protein
MQADDRRGSGYVEAFRSGRGDSSAGVVVATGLPVARWRGLRGCATPSPTRDVAAMPRAGAIPIAAVVSVGGQNQLAVGSSCVLTSATSGRRYDMPRSNTTQGATQARR